MAGEPSEIESLLTSIRDGLAARVPGLDFCDFELEAPEQLQSIAVIVDFVFGNPPARQGGSGRLTVNADFEAVCLVDAAYSRAALRARELATEVAIAVHEMGGSPGVSPAQGIAFSPEEPLLQTARSGSIEVKGYESWIVRWSHQVRVGVGVWDPARLSHPVTTT